MARRMEPRDANELALDDKLDVARTLVRLKARIATRHELSDLEAEIKQTHAKEIEDGTVTKPVVPGTDDVSRLYGFGKAQAIEQGPGEAGAADSDN